MGKASNTWNSCEQAGHHGVQVQECKHTETSAADYWNAFRQAQFPEDLQGGLHGQGALLPGGAHEDQLETFAEIDALAETLRFIQLYIYRANPFGQPREGLLSIVINDATTLEEIRNSIYREWVDLLGTHWKLYKVNDAIQHAYHGGQYGHYVIWAERDLISDQHPATVLVEIRNWDLSTGSFSYERKADSLWTKYINIPQLYTFLDMQDRCDKAPCPLEVRGQHLHFQDEVIIRMADYIVIHTCTQEQEIRSIIADPTENYAALSQETPQDYKLLTMHWAQDNGKDAQEVGRLAEDYQATLTNEARSIYHTVCMEQLQGRRIAIYPAEHKEVTFTKLMHTAERDPFGLLYDLEERRHISKASKWKMVAVHQAVQESRLPQDAQYVCLLHHEDRPDEHLVTTLVEKVFHQNQRQGGKEFVTYQTFFMNEVFQGQSLIAEANLLRICQIHRCYLQVNGQEVGMMQTSFIRDGAFLQIRILQREDDDALQGENKEDEAMRSEEENQASGDEKSPTSKRQRLHDSTEHGNAFPPPGGDMILSFVAAMALRRKREWTATKKKQSFENPRSRNVTRLMVVLFCLCIPTVAGLQHQGLTPTRVGEASNPGPWWIGSTNPGGLRGKEWLYGELPAGIWGCSETHLTIEGIRQSGRVLRHVHQERELHLLHGAPAALRARSEDAGTWTGVGFITDLIPKAIHCQ